MTDCARITRFRGSGLATALFAGASLLVIPSVALAEAITIGISTPLSGAGADYGTAFANGANLALKEMGEQVTLGGRTQKLAFAICDDEFKSDRAANCARRLTSQDGAHIVINPGTYATIPALSFNQDAGAPFLVLGASGDPAATSQGNGLFVRTWSNATRTMPGFVDSLVEYDAARSTDIQKVALMEVNSDFGAAWVNAFEKEWKRHGREIVGRVVYDQNGTDFYAQLTPLLAQSPDLIVLTTVCETSSLVIRQARELQYKGTFVNHGGCTGAQMLQLISPEMVEGMLFESAPWVRDVPEISAFKQKYTEEFGAEPQIISAVGYLDALWLARSIEIAGTGTDAAAVRATMPEALGAVTPNLLGWSNLDDAGDMEWPMQITYIDGGGARIFEGE